MAIEIETHAHEVIDTDPRFIIDPKTKKITAGTGNLTLAQHAKNSERLTFYLPEKVVEGYDMTACNKAQIHFENIDQATLKRSIGVYEVADLQQDGEGVSLSWLVDDKVTRYAGGLIFSIHFISIADDGSVLYDFPTLTYSEMTVGATVWAGDTIEEQYPEIIEDFERRISSLEARIKTLEDTGTGGSPGATPAQAAQIQANADAIADIQDPVVSGTTAVSGNTYTITMPRESGAVDTLVVEFDGNGYVSKVTENGRVIPWTTTGV